MNTKSIITAAFVGALSLASTIASAQTTTVLRENGNTTTVVRTDSKGTTTTVNGQSVYSAGGNRHGEQVRYSQTNNGGKVVSHQVNK